MPMENISRYENLYVMETIVVVDISLCTSNLNYFFYKMKDNKNEKAKIKRNKKIRIKIANEKKKKIKISWIRYDTLHLSLNWRLVVVYQISRFEDNLIILIYSCFRSFHILILPLMVKYLPNTKTGIQIDKIYWILFSKWWSRGILGCFWVYFLIFVFLV